MKQKKWLLTTLTACAVAFSAAFVGCKKNSTEKPLEEGPETGTYYLEDEFGENLLTLSGGNISPLLIAVKTRRVLIRSKTAFLPSTSIKTKTARRQARLKTLP